MVIYLTVDGKTYPIVVDKFPVGITINEHHYEINKCERGGLQMTKNKSCVNQNKKLNYSKMKT